MQLLGGFFLCAAPPTDNRQSIKMDNKRTAEYASKYISPPNLEIHIMSLIYKQIPFENVCFSLKSV